MSKQDMIWNRLPQTWYEAPFMGNGSMGTYICKEPGKNAIRIDVNNSLVHDHRKDDKSIYGRCRLLIGYFLLQPVGEISSGTMRLDLWNAETRSCIRTASGEIRLKAYVTSESPYIIVEAEATEGEKDFRWQFYPESTDSPRQLNAIRKKSKNHLKKDYVSNPPSQLYERNGLDYCWQPLLNGGGTATVWKEMRKGNKRILVISNAHSFPEMNALQKAETALTNLQIADLPALRQAHQDWWHAYYPQSFISLPDKKIENFYWVQIYKLASATRIGGGLLDNSGPWQVLTPWPNAWWNLNVQLSYWPVYTSNRLELGMPIVDVVNDNFENLINNVPEAYRKDAAALPVATDFNLVGTDIRVPGSKPFAQVGNLPWLCHNLWLQYRYSMDETILRNVIFPTLRRAINFYIPFLEKDEQGILHLKETYSPEYGNTKDCNYDIALLRWGCETLLETCRILSIDDDLCLTWQHIVDNLTNYPQNENGIMIGKDVPYSHSHRHFSHLLMFYPLYLLNAEQQGSKELLEKSIEHWHSMPDNILGFSYTGASLLYAAFGEGNKALEKLNGLFALTLRPNTMYMESGPVIETPLSGAQCVHDMLLQSWGKKIRVFPAVPSQWKNIQFKDLRTEGAFLVSAVRKEGKTINIQIKSLAGEPCTLQTDMKNPIVKIGNATLTTKGENEYTLDLKKGETVTITTQTDAIFAISPVDGEGQNFFGLQ
ncbi:alpha-L-fucosidase [Bacteroides clarus]|uniref:Alpha-L-fucosidase n=2 Tax=Bacteroides clarus TaxID=626929 RepID=A0A1Y4JT14_9BACE|nr:alpha-L-fucosidase [Bacteroides clarus]